MYKNTLYICELCTVKDRLLVALWSFTDYQMILILISQIASQFSKFGNFICKLRIWSYLLSSFRVKFIKLSLLVLNERKNLPYPDGESWSGHIWSNVLGLYFYLVGLHYPPHFDFGYSKRKTQAKLSATLYHIIPNILCWLNLNQEW